MIWFGILFHYFLFFTFKKSFLFLVLFLTRELHFFKLCHSFLFPLSFSNRSSFLPPSHNALFFLGPDLPLSSHPPLPNSFLWASMIADFKKQKESRGSSWIHSSVCPSILKVSLEKNFHFLCFPCSSRRWSCLLFHFCVPQSQEVRWVLSPWSFLFPLFLKIN